MHHPITDTTQLRQIAHNIRRNTLMMLAEAGSGHTGGSLGLADIFTVLYFNEMHQDPGRPDHPERDRLVLSVGHVAPGWYATLAEAGYFPKEELKTLRKLGSRLQGHPATDHHLPGLETSAGSLGQGLSVAVGAMSAAHHKLDKLVAIVDRNYLQIDGATEDVMTLRPLSQKWKAFGWEVRLCDGNSIEELLEVFSMINYTGHPTVIIAKTMMGKGVKSIEGDYTWHGKAPTREELGDFLKEMEEES
ncbi:MAG: transketolase [bacterium]